MSSIIAALSLVFKELLVFVAYVKNNAFPQPLQDTEEEKYLRLMAKGDPYARNKLIEHNLRLVAHIVKKFENTGEDSEDLISIGTIGLIKAIESYQVDKGTKLATYAARCIENEIVMSKEYQEKNLKFSLISILLLQDKKNGETWIIIAKSLGVSSAKVASELREYKKLVAEHMAKQNGEEPWAA